MKSAIITTLIGSAAAFAPTPTAKTSTAVNALEDNLGVQPSLLHPHPQPDLALGQALFVMSHDTVIRYLNVKGTGGDGNVGDSSNDTCGDAYDNVDAMNSGAYGKPGQRPVLRRKPQHPEPPLTMKHHHNPGPVPVRENPGGVRLRPSQRQGPCHQHAAQDL